MTNTRGRRPCAPCVGPRGLLTQGRGAHGAPSTLVALISPRTLVACKWLHTKEGCPPLSFLAPKSGPCGPRGPPVPPPAPPSTQAMWGRGSCVHPATCIVIHVNLILLLEVLVNVLFYWCDGFVCCDFVCVFPYVFTSLWPTGSKKSQDAPASLSRVNQPPI